MTETSQIATPQLAGLLVTCGLYGALVVQVFLYHISFPKDKTLNKAFVYLLFAIETAQTGIIIRDGIVLFGLNFGDPSQLDFGRLSWLSVPLIGSVVSMAVELFFAWRIYLLSHSFLISAIVIILSLFQGAAGIAQAILSLRLGLYSHIAKDTRATFVTWLVGAALCDVVIAVFMCYFLSRNRNGMQRTDAVLTSFIRLTIETGTLTALVATIDAILVLLYPRDDFFIVPSNTLAKLYSNSFMMILNNRLHFVNPAPIDWQMNMFSSSVSYPRFASLGLGIDMSIQVEVNRETLMEGPSDQRNFEQKVVESSA